MTVTKSTAPDGKPLRSLARSRYGGGLVVAIALTALALSPLGDASTLLQDTFADGSRSAELTFPACPEGIGPSQRLAFELPGDSHAWSTSLTATITAQSQASEGTVQFYIGEGRSPDGSNNTIVGHGAAVNLFSVVHYWKDLTGVLNEYLDAVGRGPAAVRVPLTLYGCGVAGNLSVSIDGLAIVYSPGYVNNGPPVLTAPVPDVYIAAGSSEKDVIDLAEYYTDPDGDLFFFYLIGYVQETYENGSLRSRTVMSNFGFAEIQIHDRSVVDVNSLNASWRGEVDIAMCTNDVPGCDGPQIQWHLFTIHVVDPPPAGVMPSAAHIVSSTDLRAPEAGSPLRFRVAGEGALPPDATFVWYLDGAVSGTDPVLDGVAASAGNHVVKAAVTTGGETHVYVAPFTVGAPLPPQHVPTTPPRASMLLFSGAAFAVTGVAVANSERGRFRLLYTLMAMVAPARKKAAVVDHFIRGQIYQAIRDEPGVHFSELVRRAGVGNGTAVYHLRLLEEAGLVRMVSDGTLTRLYPTDRPLDKRTYELHGRDRETLTAVEQIPGITQKELRSRLKRSGSAVSRSVGRLAMLGYVTVDSRKDGQKVFPRRDEDRPAVDSPGFATE